MGKTVFVIVLALIVLSCKSENKLYNKGLNANINLILESKDDIDSVLILDIGQQREFHKIPFRDTIRLDLNDSINDLYNILFYKEGKMVSSPVRHNQIWLNGNNITIKGKIDNKLIVDTIIGSDLYYKSKSVSKKLSCLFNKKVEDSIIDNYLFKKIKENIESPLSLALADNYILRNQNKLKNLERLNELLINQKELLKNHSFFRPHAQLQKTIQVKNLEFSNYKFYDLRNDISTIVLDKDKKYIIDFWFVNCAPCVKDHKHIATKKDWLTSNNFELIGISNDKDYELFKNYIIQNKYDWKNYRELDSLKSIRNELDIKAYPTYVIIDNGTKIEKIFNSFEDVEHYLSK